MSTVIGFISVVGLAVALVAIRAERELAAARVIRRKRG